MDDARTIVQNRFGVHLSFKFGPDQLSLAWRDFSGEREFAVNYEAIDVRNVSSLTDNSSQFARSLLFIPIVLWLPGIALANVNRALSEGLIELSLLLIVTIYSAKLGRLFATKFTLLNMSPAPQSAGGHAIRIIKDKNHDAIVAELKARWRARIKRLYGAVNLSNDRDSEIVRLTWLKDNDVLTEAEYREALATLHFKVADESPELERRLN